MQTTTSILREVNDILNKTDDYERTTLLTHLKAKLEDDIIVANAKKSNKMPMLRVVKDIEKKKWHVNGMGLIYSDTQTAFTDSYRLLILNSSLGYERVESTLTIKRLVDDAVAANTDSIKIDMDALQKAYLLQKAVKAKDRQYIYNFDFNTELLMSFNTEWLLQLLQAFETDTIYVKPSSNLSAVLIKNTEGELAVVCPLRPPTKSTDSNIKI